MVRAAVRQELGATQQGRAAPRLRTQVENLRKLLRSVRPADLSDTDRRALERLFMDLSTVARAPYGRAPRVFPALPEASPTVRRRRRS
jgi:hypothetical protein